jgi:hypothetical protein
MMSNFNYFISPNNLRLNIPRPGPSEAALMPATIVKMEMEDVDVYSDSPDEEADGGPASAGAASYNSGQATNTQCAVCEEVTENHHMHYGAFCCFSCRAFFRRANQRTNKSPYICKNESKCDVTFKNRKKCQKCR